MNSTRELARASILLIPSTPDNDATVGIKVTIADRTWGRCFAFGKRDEDAKAFFESFASEDDVVAHLDGQVPA